MKPALSATARPSFVPRENSRRLANISPEAKLGAKPVGDRSTTSPSMISALPLSGTWYKSSMAAWDLVLMMHLGGHYKRGAAIPQRDACARRRRSHPAAAGLQSRPLRGCRRAVSLSSNGPRSHIPCAADGPLPSSKEMKSPTLLRSLTTHACVVLLLSSFAPQGVAQRRRQ